MLLWCMLYLSFALSNDEQISGSAISMSLEVSGAGFGHSETLKLAGFLSDWEAIAKALYSELLWLLPVVDLLSW